jgi:aerobic carbon-monoxide dehydrogenase medium subunit
LKPVDFDYARPSTVEAALALLADEPHSVKVLAGGQSLGPMLNLRLARPGLLVDITGIEELRRVEDRPTEIAIGACVTHGDIEDGRVPDVARGALSSVARGIAYRAVRNRGTIGGSLAHADPAADWIAILCALGAKVSLRGRAGVRVIPVEDLILGALESDIRPGELLTSVLVPRLGPRARWGYYKACRKPGELAHAIGAFVLDPDRDVLRAVVGATEAKPVVVAKANAILGDATPGMFDAAAVDALLARSGLADAIDRRTHVVALRRALEGARSS